MSGGAQQRRARSRLAAVRIEAGVTQTALARVTGLSVATIRRLDRGELSDPPVTYLINCARALGVELDELLEPAWQWTVFNAERASDPPAPGWFDRERQANAKPRWRELSPEERKRENEETARWRAELRQRMKDSE